MKGHIPVLLTEAIENLRIKPSGIYVDATMGGAGHAAEILKRLKSGFLYCFEQDPEAVAMGNEVLKAIGSDYRIFPVNFVRIREMLEKENIRGIDGVLYDLGVSSFQLDRPERGFGYNVEGRLDMRMNPNSKIDAFEIVNRRSEAELKRIFSVYGEEKYSGLIARRIVKSRREKPVETTSDLVTIVKKALPSRELRKPGHPARKVFQALRIEVNNELEVFSRSLNDALDLLLPGGRIVVIDFHSLEDRICKKIFRERTEVNLPRGLAIRDIDIKKEFVQVNKKAIVPGKEETERNKRARSAKMRVIEKTGNGGK